MFRTVCLGVISAVVRTWISSTAPLSLAMIPLRHGERVVQAMIEGAAATGARLIAEDLGSVPTYVPASLARLGAPGYKVLIWEKDGAVFRDPAGYPARSVACWTSSAVRGSSCA